jgi:hypothetical protein
MGERLAAHSRSKVTIRHWGRNYFGGLGHLNMRPAFDSVVSRGLSENKFRVLAKSILKHAGDASDQVFAAIPNAFDAATRLFTPQLSFDLILKMSEHCGDRTWEACRGMAAATEAAKEYLYNEGELAYKLFYMMPEKTGNTAGQAYFRLADAIYRVHSECQDQKKAVLFLIDYVNKHGDAIETSLSNIQYTGSRPC